MWNNDDFSSETVDEQIERFVQAQPSQHLNAALTQELTVMCEEDRAMIERVRMRYAQHIDVQPARNAQPAPNLFPPSWSDAGAFSAIPAQRKAGSVRRPRRVFALLAAVLVAIVLVSSTSWAIHTLHQSPGSTAHPTVTPQLTRTHTATPVPAVAPSGRVNVPLVYDDVTNSLLLFSGQDYTGGPLLVDTWTWDGSAWTQLHPAHHPISRSNAAIAYDPATRQVVLFGGGRNDNAGGTPILGDTWTWNGSDWTQQHPANSPSARVDASLTYDAASGQLVLFGGTHTIGFNPPRLNDTWVWTGSNWLQQHPATVPTARTRAALAYDAASGQLILFGGDSATGMSAAMNDTWVWTGSNWRQQHPRTAPALSATFQGRQVMFDYPDMVYDPTTGKLLLTLIGIGDNNGTQADYSTVADWTWDGHNWAEVTAIGPFVDGVNLFYDARLQTIFALTSFIPRTSPIVENKLWKWTGQTWVLVESW